MHIVCHAVIKCRYYRHPELLLFIMISDFNDINYVDNIRMFEISKNQDTRVHRKQ